jgi:multidrug resistance efflux pump
MGEYRSTRGEKPPETTMEKRRRVLRNMLRAAIAAAALVAAAIYIQVPRRVPASGYATTAPYAEVRAPLTGVIVSISAFSGDRVKEGDVLVRLSDEIEKAAVQRAEIEADRVRAELAFREAEYIDQLRSHSNEVQVAALALEFSRKRLDMTRQLAEKGSASRYELMSDEYQAAQSELRHRQLSGKDLTVWRRQVEMLRRQLDSATAAVRSAKANLEARTVRAPTSGTVLRHTFFVGEVARPDQVLYEIFGAEKHLLRLKVPERYATRIAEGMRVRAQFRSSKRLVRRNWTPAVVGDMRDVIQAEGNETYRVIYCPYEASAADVPPGTTADAEILLGKVPLWRVIFDD